MSRQISSRPTEAIVNLKVYRDNLLVIKRKLNKKVMAIVKANAYGHGLIPMARAAEEIVDYFGVAILEEAGALRESGVKKPILVLGYVDPKEYKYCLSQNIEVPIYSLSQWESWKNQILKGNQQSTMMFHLKINSGMNRLGFKSKEMLEKVVSDIEGTTGAEIKGVFTHFATADIVGDPLITKQEKVFTDMVGNLITKNILVHIANSAYALSKKSKLKFQMVRIGISGYGMLPDKEMKGKLRVETNPVLSLKTKIVHIQEIEQEEPVGYGAIYKAGGPEKIGVIPIGYADGIARRYNEKAYVLVNGEKRYFAGRVCMDQAMIRLKENDEIGDEVVIYGSQGDENISLEVAGDWADTINYEVVCRLSERVKRIYVH